MHTRSLIGNRSIIKMSTNIRIDVKCTEYYELDLHCELPYQFTVDDIEDIYSAGYDHIVLQLTETSGKEFMKLARRDNLFSSNDWREYAAGSGHMHLRFHTPTDWDFYQVHAQELNDGELIVELHVCQSHHDSMDCYDVEHFVNHWEEEL